MCGRAAFVGAATGPLANLPAEEGHLTQSVFRAESAEDGHRSSPSDRIGPYVELVGEVVKVGEPGFDSVAITVKTDKGTYMGYWEGPPSERGNVRTPKLGQWARIRIYDAGGGWYPDNTISGWGSKEFMTM